MTIFLGFPSRVVGKMATRRASKKCAMEDAILLRKLVSGWSKEDAELAELLEDLTEMGCDELMVVLWSFRDEVMVREVINGALNQFDNTVCCDWGQWMAEKWREVYNFRAGESETASRKDDFVKGKFAHTVDPKDGYPILECLVGREKRILEFLISILYPKKPTWVTMTLGNTVFGLLSGERFVDWAKVIREVEAKLVRAVGKEKGTPISPYLYHLYKHEGLLNPAQENNWNIQEALFKY